MNNVVAAISTVKHHADDSWFAPHFTSRVHTDLAPAWLRVASEALRQRLQFSAQTSSNQIRGTSR